MKTINQIIKETQGANSNPIVIELKNALIEELNAWYGYIIVKEFLAGPERTMVYFIRCRNISFVAAEISPSL